MLSFAIGLGLVYGFARGGTLAGLASQPWRLDWLAPLAFALQALVVWWIGPSGSRELAAVLLTVSYLVILGVVWSNRRIPGVSLVGAGVFLNFLVIAANGGFMPVAPEALALRGEQEALAEGVGSLVANSKDVVLERAQTRLWFLSDIITIPNLPLWQRSFSVGDALLAIGLLHLVQTGMRSKPSLCRRQPL